MRATSYLLVGALAVIVAVVLPTASWAQIAVSITIAPPELPVYAQPPCPAYGYIWTPGYWAWGPDGYYWVPGTWVEPPAIGLLWTPGYWGWSGGLYVWNAGYWGPHIGFYGGVVYGCGYDGIGYQGGYWQGGQLYYNSSVTNVNTTVVRNVYSRPVTVRNETRVSYSGGQGGISARPTSEQLVAARENHRPATTLQVEHQRGASSDRELLASVNHGKPAVAATARPGVFSGREVVPARGAPAEMRPAAGRPQAPTKPEKYGGASQRGLSPAEHPASPPSRHEGQAARPSRSPAPARPNSVQPKPHNEHMNTPRPAQGKEHPTGANPAHGNPAAGKPAMKEGHPSQAGHAPPAKENRAAHPPQEQPKQVK